MWHKFYFSIIISRTIPNFIHDPEPLSNQRLGSTS